MSSNKQSNEANTMNALSVCDAQNIVNSLLNATPDYWEANPEAWGMLMDVHTRIVARLSFNGANTCLLPDNRI